jgi:peptidylprolyl isomerase
MYRDVHVPSEGAAAASGDYVGVHYTGRLEDGSVFDDSTERGEPINFVLGSRSVIKGWDEGIQGMLVGGRRQLVIPPHLGYGAQGIGPIPPNALLHFDVELVSSGPTEQTLFGRLTTLLKSLPFK